jgi:hypothetical protein
MANENGKSDVEDEIRKIISEFRDTFTKSRIAKHMTPGYNETSFRQAIQRMQARGEIENTITVNGRGRQAIYKKGKLFHPPGYRPGVFDEAAANALCDVIGKWSGEALRVSA